MSVGGLKGKAPLLMNERPLFMSAMTYSPTHFRVQPVLAQARCSSIPLAFRPGFEEGERSLDELRRGVEEDGAVTAIRHNPKRGARIGAVHVNRHLHQWIAVAATIRVEARTAGPSTALRSARDDSAGEAQPEKHKRKRPPRFLLMAVIYVGDDLLSHTLSRAVQLGEIHATWDIPKRPRFDLFGGTHGRCWREVLLKEYGEVETTSEL